MFVLVNSCASSNKIIGPDGSEHQLITCEGIQYCYEEATKVCGGKYKIVNSTSKTEGYNGITSSEESLLVKCVK